MFKIESYVTPILLSYVDKYVRDFKPADAQVSLWGGGVALHNLVLKADVLQQEVALPFTLVSGRIHELLIQVPWTKIMSEPIVVTIDTIECVLSLTQPESSSSEETYPESPSRKTQVVEAPPGYMQALVRRIVSNIALRVHHLIVKYVQDDVVMSLNVKHLAVDSAGLNWEPAFADIDQAQPVIRRLMRLDDLTLCLDRADADGKIRYYQEPLLYRCQLDFRILTRLVSANTRRASSLSIQLRSSKLAWGVTGDQLTMLIQLVRERAVAPAIPPVLPAKTTDAQAAPLHAQASNTAEPAHSGSWTEWAWSWLPTVVDREGGSQTPAPPAPIPLHFAAYFDDVSVIFKVMEIDSNNRKRSRGVLEFIATQTAFKSYVCNPVTIRMRAGMRSFALLSRGKCICGYTDYNSVLEEPTFYLCKKEIQGPQEEWTWPDDDLSEEVETAQAVDEQYRPSPDLQPPSAGMPVNSSMSNSGRPDVGQPEQPSSAQEMKEPKDNVKFWEQMEPQFFVEYIHERSPPEIVANPYENPPTEFQYSDWVEECEIKIRLELMEVRVCMGLIHRLSFLNSIFQDLPPVPIPELPRRVLTVEECDALSENLPQRRVSIEVLGLHIIVHPWEHSLMERPSLPPVLLDIDLPKINAAINSPMYPHRVCVAACQMPEDSGPLWQGARLHVTLNIHSIQAKICSFNDAKARPCFRADVKAVFHILLNKAFFDKRESVLLAYSVKIREVNVCGSVARLQAAYHIPKSLLMGQVSAALKYTTLATDALNDEEAAAIDLTLEDFLVRSYSTKNTRTYIVTLQAAKATALHEPKGCELQQSWLFSAPDSHTNIPYLRIAVQWCETALPESLEYAAIYTEPAAIAVDPLFIAWLAYRPTLKPIDLLTSAGSMKSLSSQYFIRRQNTGTSSSGRGGTKSSGAEVHMRRSVGSSDKEQGRQDLRTVTKPKSLLERCMSGEKILELHERLQRMLVNAEIGLTLVYVTMTTASAVDCATVRDAMERHASVGQDVLALSLGRLTMFSNTLTKQFWNDIRHDGPTFVAPKKQSSQAQDSFPWKLKLADVACSTLDMAPVPIEKTGRERSSAGLRSQLRNTSIARTRTVLELVTSTVTLSVVTKQVQIKQFAKTEVVKKEKELTPEQQRLKYFTGGLHFKPTTLKEFVRGPARRKKEKAAEPEKKKETESVKITTGPVVSLGIHVHADTPPLIFRLEQDQVHIVAAALHCFTHIKVLLMRPPLYIPKASSNTMLGGSRPVLRTVSTMEQLQSASDESNSEKSDLIPIFEAMSIKDLSMDIKTFFWFQWVVSRVTVIATTVHSKLALEADDIITSLDLQAHYNQLKIKVASASVRHYARTSDEEWTAGVLGGRVLEAREPSNFKEENHFMAITITQAQITNLPASWKEELHPKLLERKGNSDSMWEIYATLAPLEAVIQPTILNQIISLVLEMAPRSFCPLAKEKEAGRSDVHWPFCYVTAGGLRLLLTVQDEDTTAKAEDDTFVFEIGKVTVNPHPDNPICRRPINSASESGWLTSSNALDGHQYELTIKNVGIRCAQFYQLVNQEASQAETSKGTAGENPALKWTQNIVAPNITPILHSADISCILAPALYMNGMLTCGPAVELNLLSDCALEISIDQVVMAQKVMWNLAEGYKERKSQSLLLCGEENQHMCPYAMLLMSPSDSDGNYNLDNSTSFAADDLKSRSDCFRGADSGVDFPTGSITQGTGRESAPSLLKKCVSVGFVEQWSDPSEFLELFVTMGAIELSLYTVDDGSPEVTQLRPPSNWKNPAEPVPLVQVVITDDTRSSIDDDDSIALSRETRASAASHSAKSLNETTRNVDIGKTKLESPYFPNARSNEGNISLLHVTLHQPNIYYWRKTSQKSIQVSLFDMWIGLGAGCSNNYWHAVLLHTEKGIADPSTDIPPALATMKVVLPSAVSPGNAATRGSISLDIERPVMLEISEDRLQRLKRINYLMNYRMLPSARSSFVDTSEAIHYPINQPKQNLLYQLKNLLVHQSIESMTVQTTQMAVSGSQGAVGWESISVQIAAGGRPGRLVARTLVTAAIVTAGPPTDSRQIVMHPVMMGAELEASWEAWRHAESGLSSREPTVRVCIDVDCVELDLRPDELAALTRVRDVLSRFMASGVEDDLDEEPSDMDLPSEAISSKVGFQRHTSISSADGPSEEHFYKDDLRSGAFKIVGSGQLPMAYQVTLSNNSVAWRYPHPRAISRLVIFPLPGQDVETPCVLELYIPVLCRWEEHTRFAVPVGEPRELCLYVPPPESVAAQMWRYRVLEYEDQPPLFEFDINKFMPRSDPLAYHYCANEPLSAPSCGVTAEQLSGVVRVDSCFSPRFTPRLRLTTRLGSLALYLHNSLPALTSQGTALEGYYVSKPMWRAHRVLCARARSATLHARLGSPAGALLLLDSNLESDIVDCSTGTMEQLVEEFRVRGGVSFPVGGMSRARVVLSCVSVALHVPRLRTLQALGADWRAAVRTHVHNLPEEESETPQLSSVERSEVTETVLEGRLSMWVHNSCAAALRVGQEGTDEVVPLGPGAKLAYRWRSPTAPKKLRFALVGPSTDWHWSTSIPFTVDHFRIKMYDAESLGSCKSSPGGGVFLYTRVEERGSRLCMRLAGRLCLANMLRFNLLYKVRARCNDSNQWRTVCSDELSGETVGRTVICASDTEMTVKVKFTGDTGWSGDIPLKECPKENVPWLVKVPCEGDLPYMSVWTRVIRARSDGRIFATVWPLYVLYSHLPLDTDVLIMTESSSEDKETPPLVQAAPGRGASTHLMAPGTTAARHNLSFQYRNIDCPVTKEAVPLHYGMTDTSVFDKRTTVTTIEEVFADTMQWLERSERDAVSDWPYSIVTKHWPGPWKPALLQPRCDVTVQYKAVRAGGGCSLEVQLRPAVLLCNSAPIALTLRAHDAAPLCKLEPGTAISPPSAVLTKPFFISVEMGRETFVSGELLVTSAELGRYGTPEPGRVALDRPTEMAIHCNHKVALLTMYYEIKEEINILGMTSTYMLINRLDTDIMISALAVPNDNEEQVTLPPTTYKTVRPSAPNCVYGRSLTKFWMATRMWRGGDPAELRLYLCVELGIGHGPASSRAAPVRLGHPPLRRAIALTDQTFTSVPVVVTQVKHEGRWVVTVAPDPCPQLLVHNNTRGSIGIAQPAKAADEPSTSRTMIRTECLGASWYCVIRPGGVRHYSTPSHSLRYPPPASNTLPPSMPFLTFTRIPEDKTEPEWCAPVAAADGEQLLQLADGEMVKMRVRTHPHSTHLELRDVDQHDISASDIRNRLLGAFSSEDVLGSIMNEKSLIAHDLKRTGADDKLLAPPNDRDSILSSQSITVDAPASPRNPAAPESEEATPLIQDVEESQLDSDKRKSDLTLLLYATTARENVDVDQLSRAGLRTNSRDSAEAANVFHGVPDNDWNETARWVACDRFRLLATSVAVQLASRADARPLLALHLDRAGVFVKSDSRRTKATVSIADVQVDNLQYESGQYDFSVVCSTRGSPPDQEPWPALWHVFGEQRAFRSRHREARALLRLTRDAWRAAGATHAEITEVEMSVGPLALYVEDAYVTALAALCRAAGAGGARAAPAGALLAEERAVRTPLRLRNLHVHPLDVTLTLHTAVRMYIALDQSPLRLSAFKLNDMMTSTERLTHALTVHYLSAAILGAGWVVGGLELLGAPGALAARVGGATGGVRGVASAAAAALLRSLSAWAGSLARNLDLLAGDEEHARRAAAARRRPPQSFMAGLATGITNFAINILGAVGGLAHHPVVGVAVGETESGATALRRGLIGALAKPLSATADLVAYAGQGLLTQTGWDTVPQPRVQWSRVESDGGWRRDCVRWVFRLAELSVLAGYHVLLDGAPLHLLFTHKFLVLAHSDSERIVEMIDFRSCFVGPYQGQIIEVIVTERRQSKLPEPTNIDEDGVQISAAAMARVARYTGAGAGAGGGGARALLLLPAPGRALALHAALLSSTRHNSEAHFSLL